MPQSFGTLISASKVYGIHDVLKKYLTPQETRGLLLKIAQAIFCWVHDEPRSLDSPPDRTSRPNGMVGQAVVRAGR
jgi:hypothetical protein